MSQQFRLWPNKTLRSNHSYTFLRQIKKHMVCVHRGQTIVTVFFMLLSASCLYTARTKLPKNTLCMEVFCYLHGAIHYSEWIITINSGNLAPVSWQCTKFHGHTQQLLWYIRHPNSSDKASYDFIYSQTLTYSSKEFNFMEN